MGGGGGGGGQVINDSCIHVAVVNPFPGKRNFCGLLMNLGKQNRSKLFDTYSVPERIFENVNFEIKKSADDTKSMKNYPACKELNLRYSLRLMASNLN